MSWLRVRARLLPGMLTQSPPWVRSVFDHAWAPMKALARHLAPLPAGLWDYLLHCEGGFVAIGPGPSRYATGPVDLRGWLVRNVAFISVADLATDNELPLHTVGHLIDHYLGNRGEEQGPWLSEGGGMFPAWQQAGRRLAVLFALGYGIDTVAQAGVRDYFARSLAYYCRDRQRLNTADPQIERWLRTTLWDEAFWNQVQKE